MYFAGIYWGPVTVPYLVLVCVGWAWAGSQAAPVVGDSVLLMTVWFGFVLACSTFVARFVVPWAQRVDGRWWFRRKFWRLMRAVWDEPDVYRASLGAVEAMLAAGLLKDSTALALELYAEFYHARGHAAGCTYAWPQCRCDCGRAEFLAKLRELGVPV